MRYGFYLPTRGPTATRDGILALAREGERLGLHSAMIADHIVLPVESQSTYPYTLDGKHPSVGDALETFSILGVVAGATERLRLVTSVLVLPYRNPVLTAKVVASLDVLSGGRLTLGIGAGWLKEEFEALNSPAFNARGAVTDEWIAIFKQLWSQSPASAGRGRLPRLRRHYPYEEHGQGRTASEYSRAASCAKVNMSGSDPRRGGERWTLRHGYAASGLRNTSRRSARMTLTRRCCRG
jgi:alkanesulfonate monooxygenase SsuD/methylene tetrahydromethanopterin reductase-like flavin-dependent oxidoreductase (luciferase family)